MLQGQLYTSSAIVNGQLVPAARSSNYFPFAVGPVIQGVPAGPQQSVGNGYGGSASSTDAAASNASQAPFNFFVSPVPLLIIMFIGGFLLLRFVHYPY